MASDPHSNTKRHASSRGRTWSVVDLPLFGVPVVLGGVVALLVALGIATRYAVGPVVDALAPVVRGDDGVGFAVGLFSGVVAMLMTRWVWHRLFREVRLDDRRSWVVNVTGVPVWFASLVVWAVLMPNVRGGGALSGNDRMVIAALPGARPGALTGTLGAVVLWVVLSERSSRRRRSARSG